MDFGGVGDGLLWAQREWMIFFFFFVDVAVHMAIYVNENNILFLLVKHINIFHLSLNSDDYFNTRPKV